MVNGCHPGSVMSSDGHWWSLVVSCGHRLSVVSVVTLRLIGVLPDVDKTDGRVVAVEDGQRHGHVGDDAPGDESKDLDSRRMRSSVEDLERVDTPECRVADDEERHELSSGLQDLVALRDCRPAQSVEDEEGLNSRLEQSNYTLD